MHPFLNIAVSAARRAGKTVLHKSYRVDQLKFDLKGARDFVTNVDVLAEEQIIETIQDAYPNHAIIAEESEPIEGSDVEWIIDPLDGTANFLHGIPQFCISIAIRQHGKLAHAVVYDPLREELFTATNGSGARLNDRRIRASAIGKLEHALIGTGFPFRELDNVDLWIEIFKDLTKKTSGIRRPGSAALDLAYVACGRFDGFWESGLKIWDIAAGALLVQEAGGIISDFSGDQNFLETGTVVAGNAHLYDEIARIVARKYKHHSSQKQHQ